MYWETEIESLAYMLENHVFFCLGNLPPEVERRQRDRRDVEVVKLVSFKGKFENQRDCDRFEEDNRIMFLENEARSEKKICVLVAPNIHTIKIAYALLRRWCPGSAQSIELSFDRGLVPLIEKPRK